MIEKHKRIVDKTLINKIRKIGYCEYCGNSSAALAVHHIKSKGSGGDDVSDNLVCLCWICHRLAHDGNISRDTLQGIVRTRNGK